LRPAAGSLKRASTSHTPASCATSTYGDQFDRTSATIRATSQLAYQLTEDTNVFLRWSTGYRSGGFNGEIYNNPFEEETIEQWEFGVKSDVAAGPVARQRLDLPVHLRRSCRSARSR
jgi:hypothetical protein